MPHKRSDKGKFNKKKNMKMKKTDKQKTLAAVKCLEIELAKNQLAKKNSAISRQNQLLKDALTRRQLNVKRKNSYTNVSVAKNKNHSLAICDFFPSSPVILDESCYNVIHLSTLHGVFGSINLVFIKDIGKTVLQKVVSLEKTLEVEVVAEAKVMHLVSGNPHFPYCYGYEKPNKIFSELLGSFENGILEVHTLKSMVGSKKIGKLQWISIAKQLIDGMFFLHGLMILHNDIKGDNVILCKEFDHKVKKIAFGKCSLISKPVIYSLNEKSAKIYNKYHRQLAYELCNIKNTPQSVLTDTYSVGYVLQFIGAFNNFEFLENIGVEMKKKNPKERMSMETAVRQLQQFINPFIIS